MGDSGLAILRLTNINHDNFCPTPLYPSFWIPVPLRKTYPLKGDSRCLHTSPPPPPPESVIPSRAEDVSKKQCERAALLHLFSRVHLLRAPGVLGERLFIPESLKIWCIACPNSREEVMDIHPDFPLECLYHISRQHAISMLDTIE